MRAYVDEIMVLCDGAVCSSFVCVYVCVYVCVGRVHVGICMSVYARECVYVSCIHLCKDLL